MGHASIPIIRLRLSRAGARVALAQAVVVIFAFTLAGVATQAVIDRLQNAATQERVLGEVRSLKDELRQKGADRLPHTVDKRTHLWRGFGYRLEAPNGARLAGDLAPGAVDVWRRQPGQPNAKTYDARPFLVFSERLASGQTLSVGQDLSAQVRAAMALSLTLLLCGLFGVVICIVASHVFSRRAWRRVAAITEVARDIRSGRLDSRVEVRPAPSTDDLDELAVSFNSMLDRVEMLIGQVRQVSVDIAHDLRTPLTRVRQRIERLQRQAGQDSAMNDGLRLIDDDLAQLLGVFDALLQLAEIDAGQGESSCRDFDLAEVAIRVAEAFRPDIEESGRSLKIRSEPAVIAGDERLMAQLVANLLENALRHTPRGAGVVVAVTGGSTSSLVIEDDGPGIPEGERAAVLRPMVRLERSRLLPGSGLGLSIVAAIAARHEAKLTLEDAAPGLRVRLNMQAASAQPALCADAVRPSGLSNCGLPPSTGSLSPGHP